MATSSVFGPEVKVLSSARPTLLIALLDSNMLVGKESVANQSREHANSQTYPLKRANHGGPVKPQQSPKRSCRTYHKMSACFDKPDHPSAETITHNGFAENPSVSGLVLSAEEPGDRSAICRSVFVHNGLLRPHYRTTRLGCAKKEVRILGSR
jgi:hypothetical protein